MQFDRKTFFDAVRTPVFNGHMTQSQVNGCNALLAEWEAKFASDDIRWLAYALDTVLWETARTMQPIEEYGHGAGRSYGSPVGPYNQVYYGRGYVQLTLYANYVADTSKLRALGILGADEDLAKTPSLAMRPDIAAAILFYGMVQGWFTGKKLGDYFTAAKEDWIGARAIVNGSDHASNVAAPSKAFMAALQQAAATGAVAQAVEPAPTAAVLVPSGDPAADVLASLEKAVPGIAADTVGSIFAPADPSPGTSAPQQPATDESPTTMNPLLAISIIQQVITYAPTVEHILGNAPDIIAKGEAAIAALEKLDFATALTNAEAIAADLGISQQTLASVVSHATKSAPPAAAHA